MEQTLVLVKPDGVKKNLIGDIIARFEHKGLQVAALKLVKVTELKLNSTMLSMKANPSSANWLTSLPRSAGLRCNPRRKRYQAVRQLNGATNPIEAVPGSIRGDFALSIGENIVHGSDSPEAAEREINNFFAPEEIY